MFRLEVHLHGLPQRKGQEGQQKGMRKCWVTGGSGADCMQMLHLYFECPTDPPCRSWQRKELHRPAPRPRLSTGLETSSAAAAIAGGVLLLQFQGGKAMGCVRSLPRRPPPVLLIELLGRVLRRLRFAAHVGRGAEGVGALLAAPLG